MQHLPPLTAGDATWSIPMPARVEVGLARAFLSEDANRREQLATLLVAEPSLTLWAVCLRAVETLF